MSDQSTDATKQPRRSYQHPMPGRDFWAFVCCVLRGDVEPGTGAELCADAIDALHTDHDVAANTIVEALSQFSPSDRIRAVCMVSVREMREMGAGMMKFSDAGDDSIEQPATWAIVLGLDDNAQPLIDAARRIEESTDSPIH